MNVYKICVEKPERSRPLTDQDISGEILLKLTASNSAEIQSSVAMSQELVWNGIYLSHIKRRGHV
jgi:hypothetical protein